MRKSKLLTVLVAAAIGVSMVGCGSSGGSSSSGSNGSSSGGDVANKDKPLCWYNRQPSNSSTGELDKTALTFNDKTYYSAVRLTAWICKTYGLSSQNVIRHYDVTGKMCPRYYVKHEQAWKDFCNKVQECLEKD